MRVQRRLTVIVSLDVAGFTRLVQEDERGTLAALASIRRELLGSTLRARHGHVFKTMGDGVLIEFSNIEDAVCWTVEFQQAMAARKARSSKRPILVRAGIALADVFVEGEDRFGAAVAFVVRLQQAAPPGGIAITHSVRWQLGKALATPFMRVMKTLKDIAEPMEVWIWSPAGVAGEGAEAATKRAVGVVDEEDLPSIVVMPFDNLSGDPAVSALADGAVEEITATLSRIRDFTVIARRSAEAYRAAGRPQDPRVIARTLKVRYLLEGSVRRSGNRVRITAQLIDAASALHLWSGRYDGTVENMFDLQDRIAEGVAGALHPSIRAAEIMLALRKRPDSVAAYDLMMRALPHLWAHRKPENVEAIRLLDEALRLDPNYSRAAALAAWAHAQQVTYNWASDYGAERAAGDRLIKQASEGSQDDATALSALATATMLLFGDIGRAEQFVDQALALDPNHAWSWTRRGFLHVYRGDPAAGRPCFERAIRLSPLDPFSFNCFIGLGLAAFAEGRPEEAAGLTRKALHQKPTATWMFRDLATFLAHAGQIDAAREALARFTASRPGLTVATVADALHYFEPDLLRRYLDGLRRAGLPS
ncbi:tetratricopeptide repeat protein [Inquilinus sp. NPDC058860]|uniref:tetratricopeptide repeat protein n=1 Tax=Inquilinus sp. NPDC058860 TaxID=3346652 RepID=UPI0036A6819E